MAYSGKALALVASSEPDAAAYFIEKGREAVETARLDTAGQLPRDLAQLYFALGELRRIRAERIDFDPMPPNFLQSLEQRCQLLLDAQPTKEFVTSDQVAALALFLCSDDAAQITGSNYSIDGGWTAE